MIYKQLFLNFLSTLFSAPICKKTKKDRGQVFLRISRRREKSPA